METNTPFHCIHGVLEGCCRVCDADHDNHTDECGTCAALRADVQRLMADIVTGDNRVAELMEVIRWAHDVAITDDEYQGKNARLRRELLQKAKMVIKL